MATKTWINFDTFEFELQIDYSEEVIERVLEIPRAYWSPIKKCWIAPKQSAAEVALFAYQENVPVSVECEAIFKEVEKETLLLKKSRATRSNFEVEGLSGTLMPFQKAGVEYVVETRRSFIADEMGLGKTVQAIAAIRHLNSLPAVIVCPASVKLNWLKEINKWVPEWKVKVLKGTKGNLVHADIYIVNYDVLIHWEPKFHSIKSAIFDESHYAKNPLAKRTKSCFSLADKVQDDGLILCLTGTPILNNPTELIGQLRVLRQLKQFGGASAFRKEYVELRKLPALNSLLRRSMYIRRKKNDVLVDLPSKRWSSVYVEPSDLSEYVKAENDLISYLVEIATTNAREQGLNVRDVAWQTAVKAQSAQHLIALNTLRQLSAKAKMVSTKQWIKDFLESGQKLVVFTWHKDIAKEIIEEFNCVHITGESSEDQRAEAIENFQFNDLVNLIVCTIKAGGVGITLTSASNVLFVESGWTPADMDQAIDRCHRIGQKDSVTGWWLLLENTIDEDIKKLIDEKRVVVNATTEGLEETSTANIVSDLLIRLTKRALDNNKKLNKESQ
jgi:SNF2 family DNA or RNA helicase